MFRGFNLGRLTYKYHRLINKSGDHPGELPQAERCVVDDDEEDEEEVTNCLVSFLCSRIYLARLRAIVGHLRKLSEGFW